jgi:cytochrome b6-f complex iron-sulfur subunit
MKRHEFVKQFAVGGSLLVAAPFVLASCGKDNDTPEPKPLPSGGVEIDLDASGFVALKTVGGYAYQGDIIIIRQTQTVYLAFSKICTHEACTVTYSQATGTLPCACHGSVFTNTGAVQNGPATQSLKRYSTSVSGSKLTIKE